MRAHYKIKENNLVLFLIQGSNSESNLKAISTLQGLSCSPTENHFSSVGCFREKMVLIEELPFFLLCCGQWVANLLRSKLRQVVLDAQPHSKSWEQIREDLFRWCSYLNCRVTIARHLGTQEWGEISYFPANLSQYFFLLPSNSPLKLTVSDQPINIPKPLSFFETLK